MAQNQFINVTISPAATKQPDSTDHKHGCTQGTVAANDLTLSYDSAKFTSLTLLRSGVMTALALAAGQLPK
jgi:hypothetical protein